MMRPRHLKGTDDRRSARWTRNQQWRLMERASGRRPLWFCVWNKRGLPEKIDEWRDGLITGMEMLGWVRKHQSWFIVGRWSEDRYAMPISLTPEGRRALAERRCDMDPVEGGLVEPGYLAKPTPPERRRPHPRLVRWREIVRRRPRKPRTLPVSAAPPKRKRKRG